VLGISLPTERRLWSRLSTECIRPLSSFSFSDLSFSFSSSVSSVSSDCVVASHLRLLLFHFLPFTSDGMAAIKQAFDGIHLLLCSLSFSSLRRSHRSKPTWLSLSLLSLCRFHLRLLFFHFLAFKCILLFVAFISHCCSYTFSLSNAFVSFSSV
jgi:hypothetical protein